MSDTNDVNTNDAAIYLRVPVRLRDALKEYARTLSREVGFKVSVSNALTSILNEKLSPESEQTAQTEGGSK